MTRAGAVVIAEMAAKNGPPGAYRAGLVAMQTNADGDLTDNAGGYVPAGSWRIAGVVTGRL